MDPVHRVLRNTPIKPRVPLTGNKGHFTEDHPVWWFEELAKAKLHAETIVEAHDLTNFPGMVVLLIVQYFSRSPFWLSIKYSVYAPKKKLLKYIRTKTGAIGALILKCHETLFTQECGRQKAT